MIQILTKVVLTALLAGIFLLFILKIWSNDIDIVRWLKKPSDFIPVKEKSRPPEVGLSLSVLPSKYEPGVEVEGTIWQNEFETHILTIQNWSEDIEISDLRVRAELPGAIMHYKVLEKGGCQEPSISQNLLPAGIGQRGKALLRESIEYYINNLSINAIRLFPKAKLSISIILNQVVKDHGGVIVVKYRYGSPGAEPGKKVVAYPIEYLRTGRNELVMNSKTPITGKYEGHVLLVPKRPIMFRRDGSIRQEG